MCSGPLEEQQRVCPYELERSSTEPEQKLVKYMNMFKILVSTKPDPYQSQTKIFWYPNRSESDLYTYF